MASLLDNVSVPVVSALGIHKQQLPNTAGFEGGIASLLRLLNLLDALIQSKTSFVVGVEFQGFLEMLDCLVMAALVVEDCATNTLQAQQTIVRNVSVEVSLNVVRERADWIHSV